MLTCTFPAGLHPVNKTDVNRGVDKLISNLSLNRFTSALPFSEGTGLENMQSCQELLGQTQREALPVCFHPDHGADVNTAQCRALDSDPGSACRFLGGLHLCDRTVPSVCGGAEVDALVCLGSLQEICADELMVAGQWCRRCSGGGGGFREGEEARELFLQPAALAASIIKKKKKKQLGQSGAGSVTAVAWGVDGRESRHDKDKAKTSHGPTEFFMLGGGEGV